MKTEIPKNTIDLTNYYHTAICFSIPDETERKEFVKTEFEKVIAGTHQFNPSKPYLEVEMPCCNKTYTYQSFNDVPLVDTPCPCEKENHYILRFEKHR